LHEEIHVYQKVVFFMGDDPSFFQKAEFKQFDNTFDFLNRKMLRTPGAYVVEFKIKRFKSKGKLYSLRQSMQSLVYTQNKKSGLSSNSAISLHKFGTMNRDVSFIE
jgi:hypothetical protein